MNENSISTYALLQRRLLTATVVGLGMLSISTYPSLGVAGTAGAERAPRAAVEINMEELQWRHLNPMDTNSPKIAALWGDPFSGGPYGALLRFPPGFFSPWHVHSRNEKVVALQGTPIHWAEGQTREDAKRMGLGGYMMMPAGVVHISGCAPDGPECIEFITQDGPFDFKHVEPSQGASQGTSQGE